MEDCGQPRENPRLSASGREAFLTLPDAKANPVVTGAGRHLDALSRSDGVPPLTPFHPEAGYYVRSPSQSGWIFTCPWWALCQHRVHLGLGGFTSKARPAVCRGLSADLLGAGVYPLRPSATASPQSPWFACRVGNGDQQLPGGHLTRE